MASSSEQHIRPLGRPAAEEDAVRSAFSPRVERVPGLNLRRTGGVRRVFVEAGVNADAVERRDDGLVGEVEDAEAKGPKLSQSAVRKIAGQDDPDEGGMMLVGHNQREDRPLYFLRLLRECLVYLRQAVSINATGEPIWASLPFRSSTKSRSWVFPYRSTQLFCSLSSPLSAPSGPGKGRVRPQRPA